MPHVGFNAVQWKKFVGLWQHRQQTFHVLLSDNGRFKPQGGEFGHADRCYGCVDKVGVDVAAFDPKRFRARFDVSPVNEAQIQAFEHEVLQYRAVQHS